MENIELTDAEIKRLIDLLKFVFKKYQVDLKPGNKGDISLITQENTEFILHYFTPRHRDDKISIHVREKETNINLIRINIDPIGFHNNSDGKVWGNRLLIFSSDEWLQKNDGFTQVKAYDLPEKFKDTGNLEQVFLDFLMYINVKQEGKIIFAPLL